MEVAETSTKLVGSSCIEILLFSLGTRETFAINVFKVREVSRTPQITRTPNMPHGVEGLISLRGNIIPVLSMANIMNLPATSSKQDSSMMVVEYSKRTIGFLVAEVDRIIKVDWDRILSPESVLSGNQGFITAITELPQGRLVSFPDIETILAHTFGEAAVTNIQPLDSDQEHNVFFVDDSTVARRKIAEVLDKLGVHHKYAINGLEAWTRLQSMAAHAQQFGYSVSDDLDVILVDAEMPEMDGYTLTSHIKRDARFAGIPVAMHSSLCSEANRSMGRRAGVDAYVAKFDGLVLAETLRPLILKQH